MDQEIKELVLKKVEEFEKLKDEQLIFACLARIITSITPDTKNPGVMLGDFGLVLTLLIRSGGDKEKVIKELLGSDIPKPEETQKVN